VRRWGDATGGGAVRIGTVVLACVLVIAAGHAHAAGGPFGVVTPDAGSSGIGGPLGGFFLQVSLLQQHFYKSLTSALTGIRQNPWGVWLLLLLSFAYGIFHAVGPGHGKAVITSYLLSSGESVRRGIVLSFGSAFVQAASAILIVGFGAIVLRVTAMQMTYATDWLEILSYAAITLVGVWLLWSKTFGDGHHHHHHHHHVVVPEDAGHAHARDHDDHDGHDHDHHDHDGHDHDHHHHHDHAAVRAPQGRAARAWSSVLAVGIRPCSGAIIVLVFALSQGLVAAGVAATLVMALGTGLTVAALATLAVSAKDVALRLAGGVESRFAHVLVRTAEIGGALCVLLFGLVLLGGSLAGGFPT
jgi:ABC-type nickel/cobalt efflux system permease component RcnA